MTLSGCGGGESDNESVGPSDSKTFVEFDSSWKRCVRERLCEMKCENDMLEGEPLRERDAEEEEVLVLRLEGRSLLEGKPAAELQPAFSGSVMGGGAIALHPPPMGQPPMGFSWSPTNHVATLDAVSGDPLTEMLLPQQFEHVPLHPTFGQARETSRSTLTFPPVSLSTGRSEMQLDEGAETRVATAMRLPVVLFKGESAVEENKHAQRSEGDPLHCTSDWHVRTWYSLEDTREERARAATDALPLEFTVLFDAVRETATPATLKVGRVEQRLVT